MIQVFEVDFSNEGHCEAVIMLMNHYMSDAMGDYPPHNEEKAQKLIEGLRKHSNKLCVLAQSGDQYVGLANCFIGFGTFAAKPFINIHDIVVLDIYRGQGIGRKILEFVSGKAQELDCAKITLEVRNDNSRAQHLYKSLGFVDGNPPMYFWTKYL
jgi:ribosomal protein S18 acetylase RimI-like enzyme